MPAKTEIFRTLGEHPSIVYRWDDQDRGRPITSYIVNMRVRIPGGSGGYYRADHNSRSIEAAFKRVGVKYV